MLDKSYRKVLVPPREWFLWSTLHTQIYVLPEHLSINMFLISEFAFSTCAFKFQ